MTNHRQNKSFETPQNHQVHERHEQQAHLQVHHHEFKSAAHNRHLQLHHESAAMVKAGQLPGLDLADHHSIDATPKSGAHATDSAHGSKGTHYVTAPPARAEKLDNGMVKFGALKGAAVDTDGAGAHRHTEDKTRQSKTSYTPNGKSLDTDKDSFVALPKSVMKEHNIHLGDHGVLVRSDTGQQVPVVFGDVSSGKQWKHGQPEASVAALKNLGFANVNGARGVGKNVNFELLIAPGSKDRGMAV